MQCAFARQELNLLQVTPTASDAELKSAYKRGALKHHPGQQWLWEMAELPGANGDDYRQECP